MAGAPETIAKKDESLEKARRQVAEKDRELARLRAALGDLGEGAPEARAVGGLRDLGEGYECLPASFAPPLPGER